MVSHLFRCKVCHGSTEDGSIGVGKLAERGFVHFRSTLHIDTAYAGV